MAPMEDDPKFTCLKLSTLKRMIKYWLYIGRDQNDRSVLYCERVELKFRFS